MPLTSSFLHEVTWAPCKAPEADPNAWWLQLRGLLGHLQRGGVRPGPLSYVCAGLRIPYTGELSTKCRDDA